MIDRDTFGRKRVELDASEPRGLITRGESFRKVRASHRKSDPNSRGTDTRRAHFQYFGTFNRLLSASHERQRRIRDAGNPRRESIADSLSSSPPSSRKSPILSKQRLLVFSKISRARYGRRMDTGNDHCLRISKALRSREYSIEIR